MTYWLSEHSRTSVSYTHLLPGPHSVALVYARSGLSIKHGLCMANGVGVVDSDYRGELKVPWSIWKYLSKLRDKEMPEILKQLYRINICVCKSCGGHLGKPQLRIPQRC